MVSALEWLNAYIRRLQPLTDLGSVTWNLGYLSLVACQQLSKTQFWSSGTEGQVEIHRHTVVTAHC